MKRWLTRAQSYLSCYGFCTLDEATEPFCEQPVDQASEDDDQTDVDTNNAKLDDPFGLTHSPDFVGKCRGPNCDKWDPSMAGVWSESMHFHPSVAAGGPH